MHFNGPIVRPQTDAYSLFVEVTVGCSHNSCKFCNFYHGYPFRMAPLSQIEEDLAEASKIYKNVRNIWANGGNPYCLSTDKLAAIGKLFQKYFPKARISTYARIDDLCRKSVEDMAYLKSLGWVDLVVGMECGDDDALAYMNKGYTSKDIVEGCQKLEKAGVDYRIIFLGGLAGAGHAEESGLKTANVMNQLHPYLMYLNTVSVLPDTPLYTDRAEGRFVEQGERERVTEILTMLKHMKNPIKIFAAPNTTRYSFFVDMEKQRDELLEFLQRDLDSITDEEEERMRKHRLSQSGV